MKLDQIIEQEKSYTFEYFDHGTALNLTNTIVDIVKRDNVKPVSIEIFYNGRIVSFYLMDGRGESPWLARKRKTVLDSGHSSLFTYYVNDLNGQYIEWNDNPDYAICGGGFPIIVKEKMRGVISVSGLQHEEDHRLIIKALKQIQL